MAPRIRSSLLLAAVIAAGGGCDATVDPIVFSPAPGCPSLPAPSEHNPWSYADEPPDRMISDFESGTEALMRVARRDGQWVLGTDLTSPSVLAAPQMTCPAIGQWAGHFVGSGFSGWGANWSAIFRTTTATYKAVAYDGSAYGGISFWAAVGEGSLAAFEVPVGLATMDTAWNGSICSSTTACADHYLTKVALTRQWQRFDIRFSDMKQGGWGVPQVEMRRDQMVGFVIWPRQDFDIWIDDVRFEP